MNGSRTGRRRANASAFATIMVAIFAVLLLCLNIYAWQIDKAANKDLQRVKSIELDRMLADNAESNRQVVHDKLRLLIESFGTPEMVDVFKQSMESADFDQVLICNANLTKDHGQSAFYLYAPDDSQTLSVDLVVQAAPADKPLSFMSNIKWDKDVQTIELPLSAGQLHTFAFGSGIIDRANKFRVMFDDQVILDEPLKHYRSASTFHRAANLRMMISPPNQFRHELSDFAAAIESGRWLQFDEKVFSYRIKGQTDKRIGVRSTLSGKGPFSIAPDVYWGVESKLDLQWDAESLSYEILGVKSD